MEKIGSRFKIIGIKNFVLLFSSFCYFYGAKMKG